MVITCTLAWFDETPEDLDRFVRALPGAVDRLVALDGGYVRYPGAKPRSSKEEAAAIKEAARDVNLPLEIHVPRRLWKGQVEKRNALIDLAAEGSDWLFTIDADHILHGCRDEFRWEIEYRVRPQFDRVDIDFYTTVNHSRPLAETSSTKWHSDCVGKTHKMGLLMRVLPELRYEHLHWYVSGLKNGNRIWLYGGDNSYPKGHAYELKSPFFIEHRCHFRRQRNILANREFCEDRIGIVKTTGQEDAVAV